MTSEVLRYPKRYLEATRYLADNLVEGTFSKKIFEVINWLEANGVEVYPYADKLPNQVAGVYRNETRQIFLNEPSAKQALICLAHEAGHWLGYQFSQSEERERQAYVFGWQVLRLFDAPVSREEWIQDCQCSSQSHKTYIPVTTIVYTELKRDPEPLSASNTLGSIGLWKVLSALV